MFYVEMCKKMIDPPNDWDLPLLYSRTVSESMIDVVDVVAAPVAVIVGALEALRCGAAALRTIQHFFLNPLKRASGRALVQSWDATTYNAHTDHHHNQ